MKNKKANIVSMIYVFGALFILLLAGMILAFGGMTIKWVANQTVPELTTLGQAGNTNLSSVGETVLNPVNSVVNAFVWLAGVFYAIGLIGCIGLSFAFRFTGNKWLAGLFIMFMVVLVIASIFVSNIYEDFYDDNNEVGNTLHEFVLLSWFILYSPLVITIIGFICGVIMFTGDGEENQII